MGLKFLLFASHALVFVLCLLLGKALVRPSSEASEQAASANSIKSSKTSSSAASSQDLLKPYLPQSKDAYKELAQTIDPSTDFPSQLTNLLAQVKIRRVANASDLPQDSIEEVELFNQIHAHIYQWLQTDPDAFLQFLKENSDSIYILNKGPTNAILDFVAETGILNNVELLRSMDNSSNRFILQKAVEQKFENGADLAFLDQIESAFAPLPTHVKGNFLHIIAPHVSFEERDAFLDRLLSGENPNIYPLASFVKNEDIPQREIAPWVKELLTSDKLDEKMKKTLSSGFGYWLLSGASQIPPEERVELAVAEIGGNPKKLARTIAENEVLSFLNESSEDYRYQFRHGKLSAQEIGAIFQEQHPDLMAQNSVDSVRKLYQDLAEENPEAAAPILDLLNNPVRAANIPYYASMGSFFNVSPDQLLAHSQSLPPPVGPGQEKIRYQAWKNHSDDLLKRHGLDYVQWVTEMAPGPDKEAAIQWTSQYAEKLFPAQAEAISSQLNASQTP